MFEKILSNFSKKKLANRSRVGKKIANITFNLEETIRFLIEENVNFNKLSAANTKGWTIHLK